RGWPMTPSHTRRGGGLSRSYVCTTAQKRGWAACPSRAIPAAEIERVVVERIRGVGRDPAVLQATVAEARRQDDERLAELEAERRALERDLGERQAGGRGAGPAPGPPARDGPGPGGGGRPRGSAPPGPGQPHARA